MTVSFALSLHSWWPWQTCFYTEFPDATRSFRLRARRSLVEGNQSTLLEFYRVALNSLNHLALDRKIHPAKNIQRDCTVHEDRLIVFSSSRMDSLMRNSVYHIPSIIIQHHISINLPYVPYYLAKFKFVLGIKIQGIPKNCQDQSPQLWLNYDSAKFFHSISSICHSPVYFTHATPIVSYEGTEVNCKTE